MHVVKGTVWKDKILFMFNVSCMWQLVCSNKQRVNKSEVDFFNYD